MAELARQTSSEPVWDAQYWAGVEAASNGINVKIAEELGRVDSRPAPTGYTSNSYNFHQHEVRGGELDEVGRLRPAARPSTREASLGIDDMPQACDIVSVRALGGTSLAPEFSDQDGLPNYYD